QWLWRLSFFMPFLLASALAAPSCGLKIQIQIWLMTVEASRNGMKMLGFEGRAWLQDPATAMLGIVIATVWWTIGFNFLLYLAALQNIPSQQYEAASIDGAGRFRQFWSITMPQLLPTTVLILLLQ